MNENIRKTETKRILIYLVLTFGMTYAYSFGVIYPLTNGESLQGVPSLLSQFAVAAAMFFPAIGVLLTRLITKEGFRNSWLRLNLKGNLKTYFLAYFGPGILTLTGAVIYFLIRPEQFDIHCGYMESVLAASGADMSTIPMPLPLLLLIQTMSAIFMGPVMNFVTCFGEEWGWRGYLLPKMSEKFSALPMLLINGVIWGLWHAPLTAIGHNYGIGYAGFPFTGIAAMCGFCIVMGVFLSYVTLKTRSCIPAVLGHGAINSIGAIGMYFTRDGGNPFVGPAPTGMIGGIPFMIIAVILCVIYFRKNKVN